MLTREEFQKIYDEGPDACYKLFEGLFHKIEELQKQNKTLLEQNKTLLEQNKILLEQNAHLNQRVQALEEQIAKNSKNSNKPPSSDFNTPKKIKNLRKKSKKKVGGQIGHKGETLKLVETPDFTERYTPDFCVHCESSLDSAPIESIELRQVFELPELKLEVTEHQSEVKRCQFCSKTSMAEFPSEVQSQTQYGNKLKAFSTYLHCFQFIPYKRISQLFEEVFGHRVNVATLINSEKKVFKNLEEFEEIVIEKLINENVVNFDESGMRFEGVRNWFHVACTEKLTHYFTHEKRGSKAMKSGGILENFKGKAVHDHWSSYFSFKNCEHNLCNAHHLRELLFLEEEKKQVWAKKMRKHLVHINAQVEKKKKKGDSSLKKNLLKKYEKKYDLLVEEGLKENPHTTKKEKGKRGREKKSKGRNFVERLRDFKKETLGFMYDFEVPFSNNQAEQDIRMVKVQQKISGGFRSKKGAENFCRIRSYISTAIKNGLNILNAIHDAIASKPFLPN